MTKHHTRSYSAKLLADFHNRVLEGSVHLDPRRIAQRIFASKPQGATGAYAFKWSYLEQEILSKYCGPATTSPDVRAKRAIDKMMTANERCAETNERLRTEPKPVWFERARCIALRIIGDPTDLLSSPEFALRACFSSGAAVGFPRRRSDVFYKYGPMNTVTERALPYAKRLLRGTPLWDAHLRVVDGNVVFTVPKKEDIDRAAAKEPGMNSALQRSVGSYIRAQLKRHGIDLNDQSINRSLARKGSIDGSLATIDLSAASDSISTRLVYELLGDRWFHLLSDLRSPKGDLGRFGGKVDWHLLSTMGNGYTFELESLIFFAICKACSEFVLNSPRSPVVSVYGDDIIVESACANEVLSGLSWCGFTPNPDKTFTEGPFRESCGGHYYLGVDVKPIYIRKPIDTPQRLIWLLNALRSWASDEDGWCDPSLYDLWLDLRRLYLPPEFLGGRNLDSISEAVSPEYPRYSFRRRLARTKIDGPCAILRYFQYNSEVRALTDRVYGSTLLQDYMDTNDPAAEAVTDWRSISRIGNREFCEMQTYDPTLVRFALFPQEADFAGAAVITSMGSSG
uniref:RNA-directed RNA polymerase n=1 Tax=Beihai levi-like virus 26 TaxID=1922412 RepID=A0A1L3KIG7_9VIRU|nr:hypothetical protein [Beihai levi-like virus 26]